MSRFTRFGRGGAVIVCLIDGLIPGGYAVGRLTHIWCVVIGMCLAIGWILESAPERGEEATK